MDPRTEKRKHPGGGLVFSCVIYSKNRTPKQSPEIKASSDHRPAIVYLAHYLRWHLWHFYYPSRELVTLYVSTNWIAYIYCPRISLFRNPDLAGWLTHLAVEGKLSRYYSFYEIFPDLASLAAHFSTFPITLVVDGYPFVTLLWDNPSHTLSLYVRSLTFSVVGTQRCAIQDVRFQIVGI